MSERFTIEAAGLRHEAVWHGLPPDRAPTLVLLHEGLGSVSLWKDLPSRLAEVTGYGVLAFSRAGYGGSDPVPLPRPLDYMQREAATVLPELVDRAGIRRAILVGHSDGASIATVYAGTHQDFRIRGLVLIAPHFFVEDIGIESIAAAKVAYETGTLRARLARHHGANVDIAFRGWNDAWLDPGFRDWRIDDAIAYIRVPILIIQGTADQYGTEAQIRCARDEAYCPVDVLMVEGAGHSPHVDRPDIVLGAIGDFADRIFRLHEAGPSPAMQDSS